MTARERAEKIQADTRSPDLRYEEIVSIMERAIIEAEEEVRKGEREACAQFLDKQAQGFQVLIDHAPTPIRAEDLKRVKHSIENVAKLIRARSEGEKKEKGE